MKVCTINHLPEEVLVLIFKRFDLLEKLKLRAVCLRWKQIIEGLRIKEVSIVDSWFFENKKVRKNLGSESVKYQSLIHFNPPPYQLLTSLFGSFMRSEALAGSWKLVAEHAMFSKVKWMFLSFNWINPFCFQKYINPYFQQLEELHCFRLPLGEACLSLPNLRVLSLNPHGKRFEKRIRLELPNLYKFVSISSLDEFEFVYPQTVTHLFSYDDHESIIQLSNLEYFNCCEVKNEFITLSNLSSLKELNLFESPYEEQRVAAIYETKQRLGRDSLKMFVSGINYETYRSFPALPFKVIVQSYQSGQMVSSPVGPIFSSFFYDDLLDVFGSQALASRLAKPDFELIFSGVIRIEASKRVRDNVDLFFDLLKHCSNIHLLDLICAFDGLREEQALYDSLPVRCKYVRALWLRRTRHQGTRIDLSFILKFHYLQKIGTPSEGFPAYFIQLFFGRLKYFQSLELVGKRRIKILKYVKYNFFEKFDLEIGTEKPLIFYTFESLAIDLRKLSELDFYKFFW